MISILAWRVLVACLALAGCAEADDAAAAHFKPRAPTAWSVVTANPNLSKVQGVIERLGLQSTYDRPFSGTLLLPTNQAVSDYMSAVELLHQTPQGNFWPGIESHMWSALLPYHELPQAVSTWHRAAAVTHSTTYFDGMSTIEGSADTAARTLRPKPTSSPYHKLTFLCRSGMRSQAAAANAAPQTRSCQVTGIRDEQGNTVTFASRNTAVLGGGIVHTVNAVLKPNNVYESLAALLQANPDVSVFAQIINSTNMSCMYDSSDGYYDTYDAVDCCAFGTGAYVGNGEFCGAGEDLYFNYTTSSPGRKLLANSKLICEAAGTCALEGLRGTLSLPTNEAFKEGDFGPTDNEGVPISLKPEEWRPRVQFHFIRAQAASDFMRYDKTTLGGRANVGFPNPPFNAKQNLLGFVKGERSYELTFQSATGSRGQNKLSIQFPSENGVVRTSDIKKADLIIPPHYVHKINRVMEPPCGKRC